MRDLVPLPAPESAGASLFFLVIAWMFGGYVAATAVGVMLGGMRGPGLRQAAIWLGLLASPWNVIGQGLPPSAVLSAARGVVYLGGANLTGPLAVLATYAAAGTVLTLAATAWRRHRPASRTPQLAAQAAGTAAARVAA